MPKIAIKNREKLMLCGLFFSKFGKNAYEFLGFSSFLEAFNALGWALCGKPSNIKNYRDEFDPHIDPRLQNGRKGWHKRAMRAHTRAIFEGYGGLDFGEFLPLIAGFLVENYALKNEIEGFLGESENPRFIQRIATGRAAEEFFRQHYREHFLDFELLDTRSLGCGFDFKMTRGAEFCLVEVKGLSEENGQVSLTQKEAQMAERFSENFCLFVVKNLKGKPHEALFFAPLRRIDFREIRHEVSQISLCAWV